MRSIIYDINAPSAVTPSCISGNCTWAAEYASLGICSECHDATDRLNKTCEVVQSVDQSEYTYCNYSWPGSTEISDPVPNGYNVVPGIPYTTQEGVASDGNPIYNSMQFVSSTRLELLQDAFFGGLSDPLTLLSVLWPTWDKSSNTVKSVRGTQCALKMCVKKFKGSMVNNTFMEIVAEVFENKTASADLTYGPDGQEIYSDYIIHPPDSFFKRTGAGAKRRFSGTYDVFDGIQNTFYDFQGFVAPDPLNHGTSSDIAPIPINLLQRLNHTSLEQRMHWLAGNMTNVMRMSNMNSGSPINPNARGDVLQYVPFVHVRWLWLAPAIFELALTLLFLLLTMHASLKQKGMLWKGSGLAPFYHPLTKEGRSKIGAATSPKQMETVAENLKVRWESTDRGLRLVQHEGDAKST